MRLLVLPAVAMALTLASPAAAQVLATEPSPVSPEPEPSPDRPNTEWYGDTILIAGAITSSVTMAGVSMMVASDDLAQAGATIGGLGMLAHVITGPAIHGGAHGFGWRTGASLGSRLGLGFGIPGVMAAICNERGGCGGGAVIGAFAAGVVLPVAIDAAIAWEPSETSDSAVGAYAAPTDGGASAGLVGRF
jgi:hypothetical protein